VGLAALYKVVRGHQGMGMGDVKMIAMIGAFLGYGNVSDPSGGSLLGSLIGIGLVVSLYLGVGGADWRNARAAVGWDGTAVAMGDCEAIPVAAGTFLGIGALAIVYGEPVIGARWPIFRGMVG